MLLIILLFIAGICKPAPAFSQTFLGAAAEALGGAGRAATDALEAHYLNPAAIAFTEGYKLSGAFQERNASSGSPTTTYAGVFSDNSGEKIAAGSVGYLTRRQSFPNRTITDQDLSIDAATHITQTIGMGVQFHRLARSDSNGRSFNKYNSTLGLLAVPKPYLGLAFVAYDFLQDDDQDLIPILSFAMHIVVEDIIRIRGDVSRPEKRNPDKQGILGVGVEFDLGEGFLLRTGGRWDGVNHTTEWTGGLGWYGPNLSLAYAYRTNVNVDDSAHTFQAWMSF